MSLRDRLLHRLGVPTEPEHVEKAGRREVWKRQGWMVGSLLVSLAVVSAIGSILTPVMTSQGPQIKTVVFFSLIGLLVYLDVYHVFPWGVKRFDLVVPWQFRDAEAKERRQE